MGDVHCAELFRSFSPSVQASDAVGHECFVSHAFEFIIHCHVTITLYNSSDCQCHKQATLVPVVLHALELVPEVVK
jgi:hypothetical protein